MPYWAWYSPCWILGGKYLRKNRISRKKKVWLLYVWLENKTKRLPKNLHYNERERKLQAAQIFQFPMLLNCLLAFARWEYVSTAVCSEETFWIVIFWSETRLQSFPHMVIENTMQAAKEWNNSAALLRLNTYESEQLPMWQCMQLRSNYLHSHVGGKQQLSN